MGATIMDGAVVHPLNIVGAGSLVASNKELESGYLWFGNPVKRIRTLTQDEIDSIEYSAKHYVSLTQRHSE